MHERKISTLLILVSLFISLILGEIFLRYFLPQQLVRAYVQYDADLGSYLKPNFVYHDQYGANYFVKTNDFSFRMEEKVDLSPNRMRVIAYGDSFTFGLGLNYEHSYFAKLKTAIEKNSPKIQFINAGVGGYSSGHTKILLERHIGTLRPSAIIYFLNNNDLVDNMIVDPDYRVTSYAFSQSGEVRLNENKPFSPWKRWALKNTPYGWLNQNSQLFVFAKGVLKQMVGISRVNEVKRPSVHAKQKLERTVKEVSLQPQFIVDESQSNFLTENQTKTISVTTAHLKRIAKISQKANLPLLVTWVPSPEEMFPSKNNIEINHFFRSARQKFKALEKQYTHYRFFDTITSIERGETWKKRESTLRFAGDGHFNKKGNTWYAEHVGSQLIKFLQNQIDNN